MGDDLDRLLNPHTIAVIGGKEAERVVEQCDKFGFKGEIWPVNPGRCTMQGRTCFESLDQLPAAPDAVYVAVNRQLTIDLVARLAELGAGGAVCYAAGFAEADGESVGSGKLQHRLLDAAGAMPIIGPNCYGYINALAGVAMWPDQHGALRCNSGVAILTQSSNIAINLTMQRRGLPIAAVMTVGNQAQQGLSKLALGWLEDERITAIGLHIEGLEDLKAFEYLALRAAELRKPIVALKVGRSDQAQAAALTHTASLAGSHKAHEALFARLGVGQVHSLEAFLETLKLLHAGGALAGRDILSLSCSGGEASLMADAGEGHRLNFRGFTESQASQLKVELGEIVTISNPLDYNTFIWGQWPAMQSMYERALEPGFDLALLINDYPRADQCDGADWLNALASFIAAVKSTGMRAANVATLGENMPESVAQRLLEAGIAPLCGLENAAIAAETAASIGAAWAGDRPDPLLGNMMHEGKAETLNELSSKQELSVEGLVVPKGRIVSDMYDLEDAFQDLEFPMVLKVLGIAHKSDAGAVALHLTSEADVVLALQRLMHLGDQFLLEEMAASPLAELIVGITRDPVCGLLLTLGAGGVLAELLEDSATLLLPVSEADIRDALAGLKIGKLLAGYRQTDAADIDALIANVLCIVNYATKNAPVLEELDVNPLFATQFGSVAVDALIVKRNTL